MSDKQKSLTYLTKYLKNYKKPILISIAFYLITTIAQVIGSLPFRPGGYGLVGFC